MNKEKEKKKKTQNSIRCVGSIEERGIGYIN